MDTVLKWFLNLRCSTEQITTELNREVIFLGKDQKVG